MKAKRTGTYWRCKYNGEPRIIKATFDDMERLYRNDPKMSDYVMMEYFVLEKHEKRGKESA